MSSWGVKLEKKLGVLADVASKESIQTLANWVFFNRKHAAVFGKTFSDLLIATTTDARQWLYWQVVNEVLLNHHADAVKWDKAAALRETLGETVIAALEGLGGRVIKDKVEPLLKQWDDHNVFGGPTLVGQIRRLLSSKSKTAQATEAAPAASAASSSTPAQPDSTGPVATPVTTTLSVDVPSKEKEATTDGPVDGGVPTSPIGSKQNRRGSLSSVASAQIEYDFESKNVPQGKVDSREFLDPCKAVATLQIARDVRNDTPVQLNSLLSNLPKDIQDAKSKSEEEFDKATIEDFSIRMPAKLLEYNLEEQLQTIKTFQDIIRQQKTSREQLIHLLLKSRCQFGASEAAKQFLDLKATSEALKKRKQLLGDALELEGLDSELDTTDHEASLKKLAPLTWYSADDEANDSNKRQRLEAN